MHNRKLFDLIILGLWLFVAIVVTVNYNIKTSSLLDQSRPIVVREISVIDANSFDLVLENQNKITVSLPIEVDEKNKQKIMELISKSSSPRLILYNKKGNKWFGDLKFLFKEKEISLKDWILSNSLVEQ